MQVNGGAPAFLDKKHYSVYISQPISLIRLYIEGFMIYVEYKKKFCLHVTYNLGSKAIIATGI